VGMSITMMMMMAAMMDGDLVVWNLDLGVFNRTQLRPLDAFLFVFFIFLKFLEFGFGNLLDGCGLIRQMTNVHEKIFLL